MRFDQKTWKVTVVCEGHGNPCVPKVDSRDDEDELLTINRISRLCFNLDHEVHYTQRRIFIARRAVGRGLAKAFIKASPLREQLGKLPWTLAEFAKVLSEMRSFGSEVDRMLDGVSEKYEI
jgi:hypothetical protein